MVAAARAQSARALALSLIVQVVQGQSLATLKAHTAVLAPRDQALCLELVQGVLRWRWQLEASLRVRLQKPLRAKDVDVQILLWLGLYEIEHLNTAAYAVVNEYVALTHHLRKRWASALVNAVLRACLRAQADAHVSAFADASAQYAFPPWLLAEIQQDWPQHWRAILDASNQRPPFWLRVNARHATAQAYADTLDTSQVHTQTHPAVPQALKLRPAWAVSALPGFAQGHVSVQDAGAQLAAYMLDTRAGQRVLDVCAAPGGKCAHLLEVQAQLQLTALDVDAARMQRVRQNLQRGNLTATTVVADARDLASWWRGEKFDRILLDAPCSGSGVIRRHPDIKSLRRETDIATLVTLQAEIMDAVWRTLAVGGEMLYITCSLLRAENDLQLENFLHTHADAALLPVPQDIGIACAYGRQVLPGDADASGLDSDGFYFARLRKAA